MLQCNDVVMMLMKHVFFFLCMFLEAAPVVRVKQRTEPWINDDILEAIRLRNKMYDKKA